MANKSLITYVAPSEKYVKVSNSVVDKLSPEQIGLYAKIVRLSSGKTIDMEFISEKVQMNIRRVRRIIVELEGRGYVVRKQVKGINGRFVGWNYCVYSEPVAKTLRSHAGMGKEGTTELHDFRQVGKPTSRKTDMTENRQDNNIIKDNTIFNNEEIYINEEEKRISNDIPRKEDISFEDFYKLYPLKKSRKPAETKWNSLSVKDKKAAIEVLPQYIADCISHKRNFKYPATYLSQRTWEDDFTPVEAEEQENNKQPNGLPVGLTEGRWHKFQSWGKKNIPSIIDNITPFMFLDMQRESCFRTGIMAKILCDMEKKPSTGELLQDFIVLCEGKYSEDIKRSIGLT